NTETPGAPYDCNDDACGSDGFKSRLECMPVTGGNTYFIVIAGYAGATGDYTLNVTESDPIACAPCIWPGCAPGATPEGEACGANPDVTNGGCNSSPEVYSTLGYGETACGESWADVMRDTDWWRTDLTDADSLTWFVTASFDFAVVLLDITSYVPGEGCASPNIVQLASGEFTDCDTVMVAASLNPGSYVVFIAPVFGSTYSCTDGPWEYQITLNPDDAVTSDFFNSDAEICLILDADNPCLPPVPDPVILTGPVEVQRPPSPYPPGTPSVSIPIEIVEMSLSGSTPFGPVQLRNSHTLPSLGQIITPDIDPLGNFQSAPESFFDVFVEIDVELVELKLVNRDPIPVFSGPITQLPPLGTPYRTLPSQAPIPIYIDGTPPEAPPVGWICYVIHTPTTPLECFCIYQLSCVSGPADEAAKLDMCVGDLRAGSVCTCVGGTCAGSFNTQVGNLCLEWTWTGVCAPTALPPVPGTSGGCTCNPAPTMPSSPTCP
ncbi:MAG TPA: hypothetical protein VLB27_07560, partial [candidate division Zixibacteria bacterium]|nr:hypothetical protein [candidate division Zixibacteria bacterium]